MTKQRAIWLLSQMYLPFFEEEEKQAITKAIESLEAINKIVDIIKIEQQPTSCEHTKLKSFEMIEKIITDYQLM